MNQLKMKRFRSLLEQQLASLSHNASGTREQMEESPESFPDPNDRAALESDRNFDLRLRDRDLKLVFKIQEALRRIDEGTFGLCEDCGTPIDDKRLKARPVTSQCIECKEDQERRELRVRALAAPQQAPAQVRGKKR